MPRRVRLGPKEAKALELLLLAKGNLVDVETIRLHLGCPTSGTARTFVNNMRNAVGRETIVSRRNTGYRAISQQNRRREDGDPIKELIRYLKKALNAAIVLERSRK